MNYDDWKLMAPPVDESPDSDYMECCELCELEATESVDLEPVRWPGRFVARLCRGCAAFERHRIAIENNLNQ